MILRLPGWVAPARTQIREQFTWLPQIVRLVAVPVISLLWWALAFLPWTRGTGPALVDSWPPTMPLLFTDLAVAVFAPIGASLVVVALVRRGGLAFWSVLFGLVVSAWVTLTRGRGLAQSPSALSAVNTNERSIMLAVCAASALAGLVIGAAAVKSLQRFGFLALFAIFPVVSLLAVILLDPRTDNRWLVRLGLVVLLAMIAWRRWSGLLVWPIFFAMFWLLGLAMGAVGFGSLTLRHPGGSRASLGSVAEMMLDFVRSAWRVMLGTSWQVFWPAAILAALIIAVRLGWHFVWRRSWPRPKPKVPAPPD